MHARGRQIFLTVLAAAFAALTVVHPSFSLSHELDHLEANELGHLPGEEPLSDADAGELCGLCFSLSGGRDAVLSPGLLTQMSTSFVSHRETTQPPRLFSRVARAPGSPRAPPFH